MGFFSFIIDIGGDTKPLDKAFVQAGAKWQKFVKDQEKFLFKQFFGPFAIGAAFGGIMKAFKEAENIVGQAADLGLSIEQYQAMDHEAKKLGLDLKEMTKHIKDMPPEVKAAVDAFREMGKAIPTKQMNELADASKAIEETLAAKDKAIGFGAQFVSELGTALSNLMRQLYALKNLIGGVGFNFALPKDRSQNATEIGSETLAELMAEKQYGLKEGEALTERLTRRLARKRLERAMKTKDEKAADKIPGYRPEIFDALNRIGGFAQRGDFSQASSQAYWQRIAKATEETANNTKNASPY